MPNNNILSEFSASDIAKFKKDFIQLIKVSAEIDRYYGEARHELDVFIPKFEKLAERFNKKYNGLKIKTERLIDTYKVKLLIKEMDVKEFFANSASRIPGLKSVGTTNFDQVDVGDAEKFSRFLDSIHDKVYISYIDAESGTSTVAAAFDRNEKRVEVIYNPVEITKENSAGFRIVAFYALKNVVDKKIEVYGDASTFGFSNLLNEIEKREWYDRFNPRFLE
ncbi:MAG: hypothetical protein AABX33_00320 [Nanoarchaeota archaeon]